MHWEKATYKYLETLEAYSIKYAMKEKMKKEYLRRSSNY